MKVTGHIVKNVLICEVDMWYNVTKWATRLQYGTKGQVSYMKRLEKDNLKVVDYIDNEKGLILKFKADDNSNNEVNVSFMKLAGGLSGHISVESNSEDNEELLFNEMIKKLLQYKNEGVDHNSDRFFTGWITLRYASEWILKSLCLDGLCQLDIII